MEKAPALVYDIVEAVSAKLGREAIFRKVKNQDSWYIQDLAFSYFQKASRNDQVGYRCGFSFHGNETRNTLTFVIVHSPLMASFFKKKFDYLTFREIVRRTAEYRWNHALYYDGWYQGEKRKANEIYEGQIEAFLQELDVLNENDFASLLFPKTVSTGKNKNKAAPSAGNLFELVLADNIHSTKIPRLIDVAWPLFLWLYPSKPLFTRDASLNRSMNKLMRTCEYKSIKKLPSAIKNAKCSGVIEAAHIKPHAAGGSDKLENGIWLCQLHHRLTEGKIKGKRSLDEIDVSHI